MADPTSEDLFQKIFKLAYDVLKPLITAVSDPQARNELLGTLGLPATPGPSIPSTGNLEAYINKADDEVEPFQVAGAIADLTAILVGIEGLVQAGIQAAGGEEERTASEITTALLSFSTLEYLRRRQPTVHSIITMLNTLDINMAAAGGSANFMVDYVKKFGSNLLKGFDTEETARDSSNAIFLLVAGFLFGLDKFLKHMDVDGIDISSNYGYEGMTSTTTPLADKITNRALTYSVLVKSGPVPLKVMNTLLFVPKKHGGVSFVTQLQGTSKNTFKIDDKNTVDYEISGDGLFRIGNQPDARLGGNNKFTITYSYLRPDPVKFALLNKPVVKFAIGTFKLGLMVKPDDLLIKAIITIHYQFGRGGLTGFPFTLLPEDINDKIPLGIGYSLKSGLIIDGDGNIGTGNNTPAAAPAAGGAPAAKAAGSQVGAPQPAGESSAITAIVAKLFNALNMRVPLHKNIGNVVGIEVINIKVSATDALDKMEFEVSLDFWIKFGSAVTLTINRLGMILQMNKMEGSGGVFGYDLVPGIKWPTGAGIVVNTGVVTGGGFLYLDVDKGEYFGALELSFKGLFALKAVGIINTIMPDGSKGFSLLILITAEFSAVQLGFGFTLNGVGGLLGVNRRAEVEALRLGLKTNAIKSILFPDDVVGNITRIISDIKQIFPIKQDSFLIGIMGKIGWGTPTLVSIEIGLILELPDPKIIILGVVKTALPKEELALVKIQVNFLGVIDFQNNYLYFEARLYDSSLVGFPLTGSLALVVAWGNNSTFGLSMGGFHPDFKDYPTVPALPGAFRDMDRISLQLLSGDNPRLGIECYFAITSNSVQFGAKAELLAEGPMGFNLYGCLSLDCLFIFDPFSFKVRLEATLAIRHGSSVLFGIHFVGQLSGPTPWHIEGEVSFGLLFVTVSIGFSATWGDPATGVVKLTEDLRHLIEAEFSKVMNWKPIIPDYHNLHVTTRTLAETEKVELLIHPFGSITFSQRALPLNFAIDKYGNKKPLNANESNFRVTNVKIAGGNINFTPAQEQFAVGNFKSLSEAEKLSRKSFENLESGVVINDTGVLKTAANDLDACSLDYELNYTMDDQVVKRRGTTKMQSLGFKTLVRSAAASNSKLSWKNGQAQTLNAPAKTTVNNNMYTIASVDTFTELDKNLRAGSYAQVLDALNRSNSLQPGLKDKFQIVPVHELL